MPRRVTKEASGRNSDPGRARLAPGSPRPSRRSLALLAALLCAGALAIPLLAPSGAAAQAPSPIGPLQFSFHTELERNGVVVVRDTPALLNVPTPLNVDNDPLAELVGTIRILSLDELTVSINRLPFVTERIPASVEAIVADPSGGGLPRDFIAYGYDTKGSNAPGQWRTDLILRDVFGNPNPVRVGINFVGHNFYGPVAVIGELFDRTPSGHRTDRMRGRLRFAPVPTGVLIDLALGDPRIEVDIQSTIATRVDALASLAEGDDEKRLEATINRLPRRTHVTYDEPNGLPRVDYDANAGIDAVDAKYTDRQGAPDFVTVEQSVEFNVRQVPQGFTAQQTSAAGGKLETRGGPIGSIDGAIGIGGPPITETEGGHYLKLVQDVGYDSIAFRLLGLEFAQFDGGVPITLDATLQPGPFRANINTIDLDGHAEIRNLPHNIGLLIDANDPRVIYDGNGATIDEMSVELDSAPPLFGRVHRLEASVDDLPSPVQLDIEQQNGGVQFTSDNPIGKVVALATSGPGEELPAGQQGIIFRDQEEKFLIFGRLFGLREVSFEPDPLAAKIRVGAGMPFTADATIQQPGDDLEVSALIQNLPRLIQFALDDDPNAGTSFSYDADAPINRILVEAHNLEGVSRAKHARAEVIGIPTHFDFSLPQTGPLVEAHASDPIGSIKAQLSDSGFEELTPGHDGVLFWDTANRFAVTAKVSRLRGLLFQTDPTIDAMIDIPNGTNIFDYDIRMQEFPEVETEYFQGFVDRPQRDTRVQIDTNPQTRLDYSAGGAISKIDLLSNIGDIGLLDATLQNLPRNLGVCFASDAGCQRATSPTPGAEASVEIDDGGSGIGPVKINGLICLEPNSDVDCMVSPKKFVSIENLTLREFAFDFNEDGLSTKVFADTDNRDVTGKIEYRDPSLPVISGARIKLPTGFRAQDRYFDGGSTSGSIVCPPGTEIGTIDPDINLAFLLC
jgi:hypothetical protein